MRDFARSGCASKLSDRPDSASERWLLRLAPHSADRDTFSRSVPSLRAVAFGFTSSSITGYNVIMTLALAVLPLAADVRQPDRRAANIWHDSRMQHPWSDVSSRRNLSYATIVPTSRMVVRTDLTHMSSQWLPIAGIFSPYNPIMCTIHAGDTGLNVLSKSKWN